MNGSLLAVGIVFVVGGAIVLLLTRLYPEAKRRESRRNRNLVHRARDVGLRGQYKFAVGPSQRGAPGAYATYEPLDDEDRALYAVVGSRIESEALFFSSEMLWTDARLAWLSVPLILIGLATCAVGSFS